MAKESENAEVKAIYLDYNATTPLAPEVQESVMTAMKEAWGNPSSSYLPGVKAKKIIAEARSNVAFMIGAKSADIFFTSGGTEGNNWILQTALKYFYEQRQTKKGSSCHSKSGDPPVPHIITTNVEHDSVKCVLKNFEAEGKADVTYVQVSPKSGRVEVEDVISALRPTTVMISIMLANNESGVIQPVAKISERLQKMSNRQRVLLHTDAAQALGKIPVDVSDLGVDFLTIVGHKFYGPRIGAIYVNGPNKDVPVYPMLYGGGQERNFRPGTENTPMIAGLGTAAELVHKNIKEFESNMREVRDYLETQLQEEFGDQICFNGKFACSERLPNTCNVSFTKKGLYGHIILSKAKYLQASVGAACHAQNQPSHILLAMGVPKHLAWNALRLSVGRETTKADIDVVVKDLKEIVASI
ncbi:selenocysteine lyase-like [Babylonia areolata]|uniref:selenocysteine lyase-like n=1 Tax=Babylonia areolata TaxID=304850 RepID=UPI003FCFC209